MKSYLTYVIWIALGLIVCISFLRKSQAPTEKPLAALNGKVKNLVAAVAAKSLELDTPKKAAICRTDGSLPDHGCTPGAVFASAALADICTAGYSKSVRSVTTAAKKKIYAAYGLAYPQARGAFEADHLVPLELGGSNDFANLWPEAADPPPGFKEKDIVENYLHEEACAGNIDLKTAQVLVADNWLAVYGSLSPEEIAALKARFVNWGN
ncbi:MAG: HNH endonuclease [Patescibacteria group bacterium]|nr:HNH endonuclease [Patescibacteria group bacterium]